MDRIEIHNSAKQHLIDLLKPLIHIWNYELKDHRVVVSFGITPGKAIMNYRSDEFNKFIGAFSKVLPTDYLSQLTIRTECISFLDDLVHKEIPKDEDVGKELESFLEKLEGFIGEWQVIVPIDNLVLKDLDKIKLGNVWLIPFNKIENNLKRIFAGTDDGYGSNLEKNIFPKCKDKVCVCANIIGDKEKSRQSALMIVENVVNLLRIYIPLLQGGRFIKIGIGEDFISHLILFRIRQDRDEWGLHLQLLRFPENYIITKELLDSLEDKYHLKYLLDILCNEPTSRSKYETRILTAMRWLGMGLHDEIDTDRFIKMSIALESLILTNDDKLKSESLAERCAYILRSNQEERRYIYDIIKHLYDVRSRILHDGLDNVETDDLARLQTLVSECLFKILDISKSNKKIEKIRDLIEWVNEQKFR